MTSFDPAKTRTTLFGALLDAKRQFGSDRIALEDPERRPLSYGRLVLGSLVLGRKLAAETGSGERVGVMLPSVQGAAVILFGLNAFGRVPALLNFTAGLRNLAAACETGGIRTIVTSRRFVEQGKMEDLIEGLSDGCRVLWLEDIREGITSLDKIRGVLNSWQARSILRRGERGPDDEGVILFTSGSEGVPKGVALSNANLIANALQISAFAGSELTPHEVIFNPLPVFHSFGLTAGLLFGLFTGRKVVLYPSPLHYRQVPKLISATGATVLFATDTFLQGYARAAAPGDLASVRYVIAGAERVKEETRRLWAPFGTVIIEGYGATECAPVISCNLPGNNLPGSVGRFLPGIEWRLEPVEGIAEGGRLHVRGPNVMRGYLAPDAPGGIQAPPEGWYDTGDIVSVDDGFVTIRGRAKRFAKIGGEMISLAAVESVVQGLWPEANHVLVSLPDPRRGEQMMLVTDKPDADREALLAHMRSLGLPELWVPKAILVAAIPVTGTGKIDVLATTAMARSLRPIL